MLPEIGQIIGRYRVLDKIGEGGMGVVYRAHDEHLSRDVAIKLLPPGALVDGSARQRFRNEALALAKLNHPNIATLFDFESRDEMDFLVTEYIRGESLDAKIERTPLPEKEVIRLGAQLAAGLVAAHDAGVLHRDLKPGNIRVTPEGLLKILDFGLARLLQSTSTDTTPTQAGTGATADGAATATSFAATVLTTFAGTPPYMSPEQVTGEPLDCRSDIYSAGTVLYEMVSGKRAFPQESTSEVVQAILKVAPASPRSFVDISSGLELVILKALSKQRTARQQNARELFSDLERLGAPSARRRRSRVESIAVLPVVNHTGDTELEYLCEGITEELINEFASLEGLKKVIARNSVYRYRGRHLIPEEIGRELGVRAVLMGRLEHHAESLSLGLELVDSADSGRLWGGQFQPSQGQLSGLMREVAGAVSSKLGLAPKNERTAKRANKASGLAYDLYLKGRYCWNKRPAPGMIAKAVELFEQSSEADPKFALAYAGLADSYNVQGAWEAGTLAPQMAFPAAKKAADRALRLDANLAEAHAARAYAALHFDWDWTVAEKGFQRSLELSPNYVHCRHWRSHLLVVQERFDEALEESKRIIELDPLDLIINVHLAWHYLVTHDFARGLDAAEKSLELEPNFYWGHYFAGNAREQLGELDSAVDALQRARQLSGNATVMRTALAHAWAVAGDHNRAKRELNELVTLSRTQYVSPYELGLIHLAMDEMEEGWRLLRQACHERSGWMPYLKLEPRLLKFRSDPNFKDLLLEVGH